MAIASRFTEYLRGTDEGEWDSLGDIIDFEASMNGDKLNQDEFIKALQAQREPYRRVTSNVVIVVIDEKEC